MFDDDEMMFDDDEELIDDEEVGVENLYYDAKCEMESDSEKGIEIFERIVKEDSDKHTEWYVASRGEHSRAGGISH